MDGGNMIMERPVSFRDGRLILLDQTKLPTSVEYLELSDPEEVRAAIRELRVRGAPAIAMAAAYGYYLAAVSSMGADGRIVLADMERARQRLLSARPTAVHLAWALTRMRRAAEQAGAASKEYVCGALLAEAQAIQAEDEASCRAMGEHLLTLFKDGMGVLTHCNTGALATSRYGTALAGFYLAQERGWKLKVYADETRPVLQGARLTAWELQQAGIDVTLICDNMAASVMAQGLVQAAVVGADRIAANGDTANKIGTLGVAILARHYGIPFYVAAPIATIDPTISDGGGIPIEERPAEEITEGFGRRTAPLGVQVYNPAFDVTPHDLITAIVTERGIISPPYTAALSTLLQAAPHRATGRGV